MKLRADASTNTPTKRIDAGVTMASEDANAIVHFADGGALLFVEIVAYNGGLFEADIYQCQVCGKRLEQCNDYDEFGSLAEYAYFKAQGWQPDHGRPRRLYPNYPRTDDGGEQGGA